MAQNIKMRITKVSPLASSKTFSRSRLKNSFLTVLLWSSCFLLVGCVAGPAQQEQPKSATEAQPVLLHCTGKSLFLSKLSTATGYETSVSEFSTDEMQDSFPTASICDDEVDLTAFSLEQSELRSAFDATLRGLSSGIEATSAPCPEAVWVLPTGDLLLADGDKLARSTSQCAERQEVAIAAGRPITSAVADSDGLNVVYTVDSNAGTALYSVRLEAGASSVLLREIPTKSLAISWE
jgi:hypothetical protein